MDSVIATMTKKKMMADEVGVPIALCMSAPLRSLLEVVHQAAHLGVLDAVRPGDVDAGEDPGGHDDANADRDADRGVFADLLRQEGLVGGDQQDEAVVHDEQQEGQDDRDRPLAADQLLELGGFEHLVRRLWHSSSSRKSNRYLPDEDLVLKLVLVTADLSGSLEASISQLHVGIVTVREITQPEGGALLVRMAVVGKVIRAVLNKRLDLEGSEVVPGLDQQGALLGDCEQEGAAVPFRVIGLQREAVAVAHRLVPEEVAGVGGVLLLAEIGRA